MATGAQAFPTVLPTSRSYTPGEYATQEFVALNGVKTYLRYGNKRSESTLSLTFKNIKDSDADDILTHYVLVNENWSAANEKTRWVTFSSFNGLAGLEGNLPSYFREDGLRWRYSEPPKITSVQKGISNVTCNFVACLDSPKLS